MIVNPVNRTIAHFDLDAFFVSVAVALDLEVFNVRLTSTEDAGEGRWDQTACQSWTSSVPVPIDQDVLGIYSALAFSHTVPFDSRKDLSRMDYLCAATAIVYDAPLYTCKKSAYVGLGHGLKTIAYGPVRNKGARTPKE